MRKALLSVLVILLLVTGVMLAGIHYQEFRNKQINSQTTAIKKLGRSVDELQTAHETYEAQLRAKYNAAVLECQKGQAAYNALTATQKTKYNAPTCPAAL